MYFSINYNIYNRILLFQFFYKKNNDINSTNYLNQPYNFSSETFNEKEYEYEYESFAEEDYEYKPLEEPTCKIINVPTILKNEITEFAKNISDNDFNKHLEDSKQKQAGVYNKPRYNYFLPNRYDMQSPRLFRKPYIENGPLIMKNLQLLYKLEKFAGFKIESVSIMDYNLNDCEFCTPPNKHKKGKYYNALCELAKNNGFSKSKIEKGYWEEIDYHNDECKDTLIMYIEKNDTIMAEKTYIKIGKDLKEVEFDSNEYWKAGAIHFTNNAEHKIDIFGTGRRLIIVLFGKSVSPEY